MEDLQLLSTVDTTSSLECELLDRFGIEDENKQGSGRNNASRCHHRLSFSLAVRKRRFARYSLLIGSRYGVWSMADRRFIKRTNFYHYHHLTRGIRDVRDIYDALFKDHFYDVHTTPGILYTLFVSPRRTLQIMRAVLFYYYLFMAKDRRMECWPADVHAKDKDGREELTSLRHRLVDVYQRRMTPAQKQRVLVIYERLSKAIRIGFGFIFLVPSMLFLIIAWLLHYYW